MSYLGPLTKDLFEICVKELKRKDTKEKIMQNLVDPIVSEFFKRYSMYITSFMIIHLIIIFLLLFIIYKMPKS